MLSVVMLNANILNAMVAFKAINSWVYKTFKITMPGEIVNLQNVNQNMK
jgi:hypothetical protein